MSRRRRLLGALGAAPFALAGKGFAQAAYPNHAIRMIVPFAPGGALDTVARAVAPIASQRLGRQVVIENRPGGFTVIGNETVAKAAPDGYILLFAAAPIALNTALGLKLPYDPLKDFEYVSLVARIPGLLVAHPSLPVDSLKSLVEYAKKESAEKGGFQYATAGVGTMGHLLGESFFTAQGIKPIHVGYKGSAPALQDLIGGQVKVLFDAYVPSGPQVAAGRVRAIALATSQRSPVLPEVPTFAEAGFKGFEAFGFYGVVAPAATPRVLIEKINAAFVDAATDRKVRAMLVSNGYEVMASSPAQYKAFVRQQIDHWGPVAKRSNIQVQQ